MTQQNIEFISGDLFVNRVGAKALAQGCNCQGSMGAGIAVGFRERYPDMYDEYRRRCKAKPREFNLGDAFLWKAADKPWVFNLGTLENYGRADRLLAAQKYAALEQALTNMRREAEREHIESIAMPPIGTGYGGLSWRKVREIVEYVFGDWSGKLYVYEEFKNEDNVNR
jgi:O-acetyl-ADP-ribose deacetylase (regulator of RNase III)